MNFVIELFLSERSKRNLGVFRIDFGFLLLELCLFWQRSYDRDLSISSDFSEVGDAKPIWKVGKRGFLQSELRFCMRIGPRLVK